MLTLFLVVTHNVSADLNIGQEEVAENEAQIANQMIDAIKSISHQRNPEGTIKRFNQGKSLACLDADFYVPEDLPEKLQHGLFARSGHYSSKIRFAKASNEDDREKDFYGMSIKVSGVHGQPLWGETGVQDFVLNSYPALFAADPEQFLDFILATEEDDLWKFFISPENWGALLIVFKGREQISSPLDINYWSTTPSRLGQDPTTAIKYSAQPCVGSNDAEIPDDATFDYLTDTLHKQLQQGAVCFDLMVQFQTDAETMPIEDASVIWPTEQSPFQKVARIGIKNQTFLTEQAKRDCEQMAFNPWQSLPEHKPIGGINRVRRAVYSEMSRYRHLRNQVRSASE
jgi:catalase